MNINKISNRRNMYFTDLSSLNSAFKLLPRLPSLRLKSWLDEPARADGEFVYLRKEIEKRLKPCKAFRSSVCDNSNL